VFLTVFNLLLSVLQHNGTYKVKRGANLRRETSGRKCLLHKGVCTFTVAVRVDNLCASFPHDGAPSCKKSWTSISWSLDFCGWWGRRLAITINWIDAASSFGAALRCPYTYESGSRVSLGELDSGARLGCICIYIYIYRADLCPWDNRGKANSCPPPPT
jgi:hypothetical protein